jgi:RNA polymerase sigma-70 factor, ECF subfamily
MTNHWQHITKIQIQPITTRALGMLESTSPALQTAEPVIGSGYFREARNVSMKPNAAQLEDSALIELTLAGETACFNVLIDRHQASVRTRIRSMTRKTEDEDDLVQQVFFKAWRHLASFRSEAQFRTWITQIATNEVLQLYRRESHSPLCPALANLDTFASKIESPQQSLERSEAVETVRRAIRHLPAIYRQILVLRDLKQLSEADTARLLQASIPMVKSRLFRARQMLSAELQRRSQRVPRRVPKISRAA